MTNKTGQDAIMGEFKAKKQNIEILYENYIWNKETEVSDDRTVSYLDIKGYSLNGPYLIVQLHNDTQYVYPMSNISSLKLTVSE